MLDSLAANAQPVWRSKQQTLDHFDWEYNQLRHLVSTQWESGVEYFKFPGEKENRFNWEAIELWFQTQITKASG